MAVAAGISSSFRLPFSRSITGSFSGIRRCIALPSGCRYVMNNAQRGVRNWRASDGEGKETNLDIATLSKEITDNIERCGFAKCSTLSKVFYNVKTVEDLDTAEKALLSFRRGVNPFRSSTPMIVIRACIHVGRPNRALHFIKHRVQYGIFPTVNTFNVLMDAFLLKKEYKAIVSTYNEMVRNELQPNAMSHYLAVYGYLLQEESISEEALNTAKELCEKSIALSRTYGVRAYHLMLKVLQERNDRDNCRDILLQFHSQYDLYNTFDANWRIREFLYQDMMDEIFSIMDTIVTSPSLSVLEEVFTHIEDYVTTLNSSEYQSKLEDYKNKIIKADKLKQKQLS